MNRTLALDSASPSTSDRTDAASNRRASDTLLLVAPGLIWGASFLFIAEGLAAIGPFGLTLFRVLVGFATLALLPGARRSVPRCRLADDRAPRRDLDRAAARALPVRRAARLVGAHRDDERRDPALHRDRRRAPRPSRADARRGRGARRRAPGNPARRRADVRRRLEQRGRASRSSSRRWSRSRWRSTSRARCSSSSARCRCSGAPRRWH